MSGGVDSSVAAALLKERGFSVVGIHLKCWNVDGCAEEDAEDARRAAETLGIPFYVLDFEQEYKERVVEYMVRGYRRGITPNPDVMCNREIKFGLFLEKALAMGADYVATGHYVKLITKNFKQKTIYTLHVAKDLNKDQSYFLWMLTEKDLKHCLFPIGDYTKPEVRKLAKKFGLPNAEKKDSQGICFLGKVTLADFLGNYIPARRGKILSTSGEVLGEHNGAEFYTIGQRHIGIANVARRKQVRGKDPQPLYVARKNVKTNTLIVAEGSDNEALFRKEIRLTDMNFIASKLLPGKTYEVYARIRYRQPLAKANLQLTAKDGKKTAQLIFAKPQKFVAEGQSAVFYDKNGGMLGGGIIV